MGQMDKLIARFKQRPTDFSYDELKRMLSYLGYEEFSKGKTSGSRVIFIRESDGLKIFLHKPHPSNILKSYQINEILNCLIDRGDIDE